MTWLKKIWNKLFKDYVSESSTVEPPVLKQLNLGNVDQFDDVWIQIGDDIFSGWVVERKNAYLSIVYVDNNKKLQDAVFKIERPLNRTVLEQNNKILLLENKRYENV